MPVTQQLEAVATYLISAWTAEHGSTDVQQLGEQQLSAYKEFSMKKKSVTTVPELNERHAAAVGELAASTHRLLEIIGDKIAKRHRYKEHKGIDAVHFFLCDKHHWTPSKVRSMPLEDLHFMVAEEDV